MNRAWLTRMVWLLAFVAFAIATGCIPSCNIPQRREAHRRLPPPPQQSAANQFQIDGQNHDVHIQLPVDLGPRKGPGIGFEWDAPEFWLPKGLDQANEVLPEPMPGLFPLKEQPAWIVLPQLPQMPKLPDEPLP
jgi:hypothetical protein